MLNKKNKNDILNNYEWYVLIIVYKLIEGKRV